MGKAHQQNPGSSRRDFIKNIGMILAAGIVLPSGQAFANKSSVRIVAPEKAAAGEEITIELHVSHSANNFFHYTEQVVVLIDGQEAQRWNYGAGNKPESENFTVIMRHTMNGPIEINAEAICNIHGSAGVAQATVALR